MAIPGYSQPHQMEPMLPADPAGQLAELARQIRDGSIALASRAHPATLAALRELLRAMNSYYSNRIEGQSTHPTNIQRALARDFSTQPDVARLQRIALAHLEAERALEANDAAPLSATFPCTAHREMYARLDAPDRTTPDGHVVAPGELRTQPVLVGVHLAPIPDAVPRFLARYEEVYARDASLIAIAAAHHRLAWIHPFLDGNGRAGRLVTHRALLPTSNGLWSICRGLARRRDEYYARLREGDGPRRGALDGRGNLTDEGLLHWCAFFLKVCADQVSFMSRLLDLDGVRDRILDLVHFRALRHKVLKPEVGIALHHVFASGPVTRGEFKQLTGLPARTAQRQLQALLQQGLLVSPSPQAKVTFGLPLDALQFLFPDFYPEAASRNDELSPHSL